MEKKLNKTILIAGCGGPLLGTHHLLNKKDIDLIIVDDLGYDLEINGIKYKKIKVQSAKKMNKIMALAAIPFANPYSNPFHPEPRKRPVVDLIEEFTRIQNKQSSLCRSDRDWVESSFLKLYKKI